MSPSPLASFSTSFARDRLARAASRLCGRRVRWFVSERLHNALAARPVGHFTALALSALRAAHHRARQHSDRELAVAPRQVSWLRASDLAPLPDDRARDGARLG